MQAKLVNFEETEKGFNLTFIDQENNQFSGIYNNGNLSAKEFKKLIGHDISFSEKENSINVHKAWDDERRPTYCDDPKHGFDR